MNLVRNWNKSWTKVWC